MGKFVWSKVIGGVKMGCGLSCQWWECCPKIKYISLTEISRMIMCDRSRMQLKMDVSDVTVSAFLKLLVQQLRLSNVPADAPAAILQFWLDLSLALCRKQMLSCVLLLLAFKNLWKNVFRVVSLDKKSPMKCNEHLVSKGKRILLDSVTIYLLWWVLFLFLGDVKLYVFKYWATFFQSTSDQTISRSTFFF